MSVFLARGSSAAAVLVISAQSAFADVSAQDVWSDWKSYMTGVGYTVTGTESQSGNTLTVSDIAMSFPIPDEEGATVSTTMSELKFVENGDGTVNILMPSDTPMLIEGSDGDDQFKIELIYTHDGSPMVVSGDTSKMHYEYTTETATLTLGKIEGPEDELPADALAASVVMSGLSTKTDMTIAGQRSYDQTMQVAELSYDFSFQEPEGSDNAMIKGALQNLVFTGTSTVPTGLESPDMGALVKAGFGFDGNFTYGGGNSQLSGQDGRDSFEFQSSSTGGSLGVAMGQEGISYDISQQGVSLNISGSEIPFPLALTMAELGFKLAMPILQSEDAQDFAMGVTLRDFAVPDMLWGMVDPTGTLPHDPATIVLDLSGKAKLLFDLLDPKSIEAMERGNQEPGELNAVTIKALQVSAAGAELTGTGDFTFNNDDMETFDGIPAPDGVANVKLTGANGLIDKLIQMGLMSENDAMGARMMMGMFGVPGEGEDTLTSEIKVSEDGQIHANGQRIK